MENCIKNEKMFTEEDIENFKIMIKLAESDNKLFQDLIDYGAPKELTPKLSLYYAGIYISKKI
ncbi:hypothetical protein HBP99_15685 [Listeria booriae]|uniref:hypothetical protein n=1 Tax=Listeria booriae TaxID=1552123 RepID=UPI0016275F42|nr:hypothetical protein [Listeria booriae]MBC2370071.1 hypothetical protein [Listeria booriae]